MYLPILRENWNRFGQIDPLWAVLTDPSKKGGRWDEEEFFQTGAAQVRAMMDELSAAGITPRAGRSLDFGCGVGRLTRALGDHFDESWGVDIAPSMIERARRYNRPESRCRFFLNDRDDLRLFDDATFDLVLSDRVLQHMRPAYSTKYIKELVRVLRPGGVAVFQIPNRQLFDIGALTLSTSACRCGLSVERAPGRMIRGAQHVLMVTVENRGDRVWPAVVPTLGFGVIRLGNHWLGESGALLARDDGRAVLPRDLLPGQRAVIPLQVRAPGAPGRYTLELDMVQEEIGWFADRGGAPLRLQVICGETATNEEAAAPATNEPPDVVTAAVDPASPPSASPPGPAEAPPEMEMHAVDLNTVLGVLRAVGGRLAHLKEETHSGPGFQSFTYFVTKATDTLAATRAAATALEVPAIAPAAQADRDPTPILADTPRGGRVCLLGTAPEARLLVLARRIKHQRPDVNITLLCDQARRSALEAAPEIDLIYQVPGEISRLGGLVLSPGGAAQLRDEGFAAAVVPAPEGGDPGDVIRALEVARMTAAEVAIVSVAGDVQRVPMWRRLSSRPHGNIIAASRRCNLACIYCSAGDRRIPFGADLPPRRFDEIMAALEGSPEALVAFVLEGEPLMNPDLLSMARDVKARGRFLSMTTNANLVDRPTADALVEIGIDELRISLTAADEETYEKLLRGGKWSVFLDALAALGAAKRAAGSATPRLVFIVVGMKMNIEQLPAITRLAARVGVDKVIVNAFMENPRTRRQSLVDHPELLREQLAAARAAGAPAGVEVVLEADQYEAALAGAAPASDDRASTPRTRLCVDPWLSLLIRETGEIEPCCGGIKDSFGDLTQSSLEEVWNNEHFMTLRDELLRGALRRECEECKTRSAGTTTELWKKLTTLAVDSATPALNDLHVMASGQ